MRVIAGGSEYQPGAGRPWQQISGSIGSRTARDGSRDNNASFGYRKDLQDHVLQSVSVTALTDTYGVGLSSLANFRTDAINGDGFIQRSSFKQIHRRPEPRQHPGGGRRNMALTSQHQGRGAGMIVDVESDIDGSPACRRPQRRQRGSLRPGRNFIPLTAYKNSSVSFDFEGNHVPAASIEPSRTRYHLNKGGVEYRKVRVMKTLRTRALLDPQGRPLKGHHVINHASRGVSEVDGFFSMEMNAGSPTLEVRYADQLLCQFRLDVDKHRSENNVLMIGDLRCSPDTLADATHNAETAG
jgi:hypothetical protein